MGTRCATTEIAVHRIAHAAAPAVGELIDCAPPSRERAGILAFSHSSESVEGGTPTLEKRNGLTPPSVNLQPSCPACDIFHGQNDTYPDLPVHLRRETHVGKRIAKGGSTCGQDRCLGSHGDGRKRSRLEATLRVCAVTLVVSDMAKYYNEVQSASQRENPYILQETAARKISTARGENTASKFALPFLLK
jgi:hypothetical protein